MTISLLCSQVQAVDRDLHSFPTRRSSDLGVVQVIDVHGLEPEVGEGLLELVLEVAGARSEEHTSELQSHSDLVCRLLLAKTKPSWGQREATLAKAAPAVSCAETRTGSLAA